MSERGTEFTEVLELCRDQDRRIILAVLAHEQRSLTLNDLVKTIVKYNHNISILDVSEEDLSQIQISLYHYHIPMLEAASVINYDSDRKLVEPTERFREIQSSLSAVIEADPELEPPVEL